jgi:hypothetical protein
MVDFRKIVIIFVIAVLFSVFVFAVIGAVYPEPQYGNFCKNKFYPRDKPISTQTPDCKTIAEPTIEEQKICDDKHGIIDYMYNSKGCSSAYECNTCQYNFDQASQKFKQYVFYISAILSLIAIFVGMYLPAENNSLNEWIGTGFMLGGAFTLFFGTMQSFNSLDRFVKPVVIFLELVLVIFIAYRKIGNLRKDPKRKK